MNENRTRSRHRAANGAAGPLPAPFADVVEQTRKQPPMRVAVVQAAQRLTLEAAHDAAQAGLAAPLLIGPPGQIEALCHEIKWDLGRELIVPADSEAAAAAAAVHLVQQGAPTPS